MSIPETQAERAEAFTDAVLRGRADLARELAMAEFPEDATEEEKVRWTLRRRLYRPRPRAAISAK